MLFPLSDLSLHGRQHLGLLLACALAASAAHAQVAADAALVLKGSRMLNDKMSAEVQRQQPTFLRGDRMSGRPELDTVVDGHAELRRGATVIRADRIEYYQPDDLAKARGDVYVNRKGNVFKGPLLELEVEAFQGFFSAPSYRFLKNEAYGQASRADFLDENHSVVHDASYTTCQRQPGPSWLPDWVLSAARIHLDDEEEVGTAEGAVLRFKGLPVLPIPGLSFPLSDKRKSGFLPPTISPFDNLNGATYSQPFYWDIAPNRDATIDATLMSKRGVNFESEFRYLEPLYRGQARYDYMPSDKLRERSRWGANIVHTGLLDASALGLGGLGLNLNLNRVSDDNYWRDFPRAALSLTTRLLPADGTLTWGRGDFSMGLRTLKWQTLQDPTAPITPPYDRLPQLTGRFFRSNVGPGLDVLQEADYTQFSADPALTNQANARRIFSRTQISRPWQAPGWFVIPKLQLHATSYEFDRPISNGATTASRVVPTLSIDSGLVFERDAQYFGRAFLQTLEPRAFYVHTPFRDQSLLPLYDTGVADFNFATIYTENAFAGNDRIADNNLLTLGVTSRLLDPATGAEALRLGVAQRLRFKDQRVTLNASDGPVVDRVSDLLLGASVNWTPQWTMDSTLQFNQKTDLSTRAVLGTRYTPTSYRTLSAAYRFQRDISQQVDIGWQWPLNDLWGDTGKDLGPGRGQGGGRWYSVGRLNYSVMEQKLVDAVIGIEYDACCWLGRVVLERLTRGGVAPNTRILFQLEFVGFSRVGSNPLQTLKRNVPRYQYLREPQTSPSHFSNYD
ncbi:MAG: hypothetical protein RLZZ401_1041 [Pseudomonadota bacterium]|jgi:LPS-assembly protein